MEWLSLSFVFLNGEFRVLTTSVECDSNDVYDEDYEDEGEGEKEIVLFSYPGYCDSVEMFEDGFIHAYTICSQTDRAFTEVELSKLIKNIQDGHGQGSQKIKVNGDRPFVQTKLKVFYVDTISVIKDKEQFRELQSAAQQVYQKKKQKNENDWSKLVSFEIDWNSHYSYNEFIRSIMDSPQLVAAKDFSAKTRNIVVNTTRNTRKCCIYRTYTTTG